MKKHKSYELGGKNLDPRTRGGSFLTSYLLPRNSRSRGDILISVIVFAAIAITVTIGLVNWGAALLGSIRNVKAREQAFQIAEAGINYYQWHLAQFPTDYKDSATTSGPYVHKFYDKDGELLGSYSLTITPPPVGSTVVKILSQGTLASSTITRKVQASLAIPSLAKYAVVANDNMRFGAGTVVNGPIQSNRGIHFDGVANNLVSSALTTYTDPDTTQNEWAVYTTSGTRDPHPSGAGSGPVNYRPDVFAARQFPVPAVDFTGLTANLGQLQALAQAGGKEWAPSSAKGYHIVFKVNSGVTSYDMYKVTALQPAPTTGSPDCGADGTAQNQINSSGVVNTGTNWGTWTINGLVGSTQTGASQTKMNGPNADLSWPTPANGVIFVDDNVWVDGTINNARITVVSGIIGASSQNAYTNITVNTNLRYTNTDGTDVIGLIAQGNINSGLVSDDSYEIDAALVAMNGRVGRFYYNSNCVINTTNYSIQASLTLTGMIATAIRYGFAYTDINGNLVSGYTLRNINYDGYLLYGPPPSFPQATNQYQIISWQEM